MSLLKKIQIIFLIAFFFINGFAVAVTNDYGNTSNQEYGDVVYNDLTILWAWNYNHTGIYAGINSSDSKRVIEAVNATSNAVRDNSFYDFTNDPGGYYGAYTLSSSSTSSVPMSLTFTQRKAIIQTGRDLVADSTIGYPSSFGLPYDALDYAGTSFDGSVSDIDYIRCDGVTEYCYEKNGHEVWWNTTDSSAWNISNNTGVELHNDMPDLSVDPHRELSPWAQRGSPPNTGPSSSAHQDNSYLISDAVIDLPTYEVSTWLSNDHMVVQIQAKDVKSGIHLIGYMKPGESSWSYSRNVQHPSTDTYTKTYDVYSEGWFYYYAQDNGGNYPSTAEAVYVEFPATAESDLTIVEPVVVSPASVAPGGTIRVDWTEKNQGTAASSPAHNTKIFLSTSAYGTTYQVGYYGPMNTLGVGATQSYYDPAIVVPTSVPAGDYYVTVYIDCDSQVSEENENNNIGSSSPNRVTVTVTPQPPNDMFANATAISGTSGQTTGSNVGATKESGEPSHAGNAGGASVWWCWTAPASGQATINTNGSSFDTLLGVYTGSSVGSLTLVASDDDGGDGTQSLVTFNAVSGTTYRIAVDGYGGVTGNITLNWSLIPSAPPNDMFANAAVISGTSGQTTGSNVGATKEPGEPSHAGNSGGASVWWYWTAPTSSETTIDTFGSSFDTLLAVYTGSSVGSLTPIASNDDSGSLQSQVTFTAVSGTTYRIAVDGYNGATGNIILNWGLIADLDGDCVVDFADFALFASNWLKTDCEESNNWCEGTDFDHSGSVDMLDLTTFARYWLEGI